MHPKKFCVEKIFSSPKRKLQFDEQCMMYFSFSYFRRTWTLFELINMEGSGRRNSHRGSSLTSTLVEVFQLEGVSTTWPECPRTLLIFSVNSIGNYILYPIAEWRTAWKKSKVWFTKEDISHLDLQLPGRKVILNQWNFTLFNPM